MGLISPPLLVEDAYILCKIMKSQFQYKIMNSSYEYDFSIR